MHGQIYRKEFKLFWMQDPWKINSEKINLQPCWDQNSQSLERWNVPKTLKYVKVMNFWYYVRICTLALHIFLSNMSNLSRDDQEILYKLSTNRIELLTGINKKYIKEAVDLKIQLKWLLQKKTCLASLSLMRDCF